jgi:hypothetical protein
MARFWSILALCLLFSGQGAADRPIRPIHTCIGYVVEVVGALSKETVRRVFGLRRNEIRACYEGGLLRDPTLRGRIAVRFRIDPEGQTREITLAETSLHDERVEQCINQRVAAFMFPAVPKGADTVVTYRFRFEPRVKRR